MITTDLLLTAGIQAVLAGIALAGLTRPEVPIVAAIVLWIGVPTVAAQAVTHLPNGVHPSSIIVVVTFAAQLTTRRLVRTRHGYLAGLVAAGIFVLVDAYVFTALGAGGSVVPSAALLNQMLAPFLIFLLICYYVADCDRGPVRLRNLVLGIAGAEAAFSIVQGARISAGDFSLLPFASWYQKQYWFSSLERAVGTTDHYLVLGLLLASCIPLVASLESAAMQLVLSTLLLLGVVSASNRAASVVAVLAIAYVLLRGRGSFAIRCMRLLGGVVALVAVLLSSVGEAVLERLSAVNYSDPSTQLRVDALRYFSENWTQYLVVGGGIGSTSGLGGSGVLKSSFENPVLIYVFEIGFVATLVLVAAQAYIIWRGARSGSLMGGPAAAVACLVVSLPFNSTTSASAGAPILWVLLALAYSGVVRPAAGTAADTVAAQVVAAPEPERSRPAVAALAGPRRSAERWDD